MGQDLSNWNHLDMADSEKIKYVFVRDGRINTTITLLLCTVALWCIWQWTTQKETTQIEDLQDEIRSLRVAVESARPRNL